MHDLTHKANGDSLSTIEYSQKVCPTHLQAEVNVFLSHSGSHIIGSARSIVITTLIATRSTDGFTRRESHLHALIRDEHDAPSWSRTTSATVLLACTALYAMIAGTFGLRTQDFFVTNHVLRFRNSCRCCGRSACRLWH